MKPKIYWKKKNPSYALGKGVGAIQFVLIVNAI